MIEYKKINIPLIRRQYPKDIKDILLTPDPHLWISVIRCVDELLQNKDLTCKERKKLEGIKYIAQRNGKPLLDYICGKK